MRKGGDLALIPAVIVNCHVRRAVRQQWLNYHGRSLLPIGNWTVPIQVVRDNVVKVPFEKLGVGEQELDNNFPVMTDLLFWELGQF